PPVRDDHGQRIGILRTDVDEMNIEAVDLGRELRQGAQLRLDLMPVVIGLPVAREFAHSGKLHALRRIRDGLLFRPPGGGDAPGEVRNLLVRNLDAVWTDRSISGCRRGFSVVRTTEGSLCGRNCLGVTRGGEHSEDAGGYKTGNADAYVHDDA